MFRSLGPEVVLHARAIVLLRVVHALEMLRISDLRARALHRIDLPSALDDPSVPLRVRSAYYEVVYLVALRAAVRDILDECQIRGANEVRLSVYAMNEAGLGLYRSLGYEINSYSLKKNLNPSG